MITMSAPEIQSLKESISEVNDKVSEILFYLHNDPKTGRVGLVQQVKDHEKLSESMSDDITKIQQQKAIDVAVRKSTMAIFGTIGGLIGGAIIWLAKIIATYLLAKI